MSTGRPRAQVAAAIIAVVVVIGAMLALTSGVLAYVLDPG